MRKPVFIRPDTNRAVQPKMARGFKFQMKEVHVEGVYLYVAKAKALIICAVTAQLICAFVFACATFKIYANYASLKENLS